MTKILSSFLLAGALLAGSAPLQAVTNTPPDFDLALYPGVGAQEGNGIATDASGNIYVTGQYVGNPGLIGGATLTNNGSQDFYLASFNSNGVARWGIGAGTSSSDFGTTVKLAANGDLLVAMSAFTPINLHGTNVTGSNGSAGRDAILARYTTNGVLLWAKAVGGTGSDQADDLAFDTDGTIILAGRIEGEATIGSTLIGQPFSTQHFIAKFTSSGDVVWAKAVSATSVTGTGVAVDSNHDIVVTGGGKVVSDNSIMVAKYNSSGTQLWQTNHVSSGGGTGIGVDSANNIYVCGTFSSTNVTIGSTTLENPNFALRGFVAKYNSSGSPLWASRIGGRAYRLVVQPDASVITCGFFLNASTNFDYTALETKPAGFRNGYLAKHDSSGQLTWVKRVSDPFGNGGEIIRSITSDNSGIVHVIGEGTTEAMDFTASQQGSVIVGRLLTNSVPRFTLTTSVSPTFSGVIGAIPDHADGTYFSNTVVQLRAYPGGGKMFVGWSGGASGRNNPLNVIMDSDKTIVALITNIPVPSYKLSLESLPAGGGAILANPPSATGNYDSNTVVTLTVVPANSNMVFSGWIGLYPIRTNNPAVITMLSAKTAYATWSNAATATYEFTQVAWTNTSVVGGGLLSRKLNPPVIDRSNIVFQAGSFDPVQGLYSWQGSNVTKVVDTSDTAPNTAGNYKYFPDYDLQFGDDGTLLFGATNSTGVWGIYSASNGVVSRVVDSTFVAPPGASNFVRVRAGTKQNDEYAFVGYRNNGNSFPPSGVYTLKNGTITKVVDQASGALPGGTLPYLSGDSVDLKNGGVAFYASKGASNFQTAGIYYRGTNGVINTIADTNTIAPGSSGTYKFTAFVDSVFLESNKVVFFATYNGISGFFSANVDGTGLTNLVDLINSPVPQTVGGTFQGLDPVGSYKNGRLLFQAYYNGFYGLYIWDRGVITRVISRSQVLRYSSPISSFSISAHSIQDDGYIAFLVTFNDGAKAIYTTLPNPLPRYALTLGSNPSGAGDLYCYPNIYPLNSIPAGTLVTVSGGPLDYLTYTFTNWTGSFGVVSTNPIQFVMNGNVSLTANFFTTNAPAVQFTLTTNVSPSGSGAIQLSPDSNDGKYNSNSIVQLTAVAASGKVFAGWSGAVSGNANPINVTMSGNKTVTATFSNAPQYYVLSTNLSLAGSATISASPAPTVNGYAAGTVVNLTVTPKAGFKFVKWTGASSALTATTSVTMNGDKSITAVLSELSKFNLTVALNPAIAGTVIKSPAAISTTDYYAGTTVTLTPVPKTGFKFVRWTGSLTGTNNPGKVLMNTNKTVTAVFTTVPTFQLTGLVAPIGAGDIFANPAPATNGYSSNTVVGLTATANGTNQFSVWSGGASSLSNQVNVKMNANKTVTAVFNTPGKLYWQSTNSYVSLWFMQNSNFVASAYMNGGKAIAKSWRLAGTVDFNYDGGKDLLFQNGNGSVMLWMMTNNLVSRTQALKTAPLGIRLIGAGEFTTNSSPDLLWQNTTTGALSIYKFNGTNYSGVQAITSTIVPGTAWKAIAVADFNNDQKSDIVLQNKDGRVMLWFMNGTTMASSVVLNGGVAAPTGWKVAAVSDLDDNGSPDILFQVPRGKAGTWALNGTNIVSQSFIANSGAMPLSWTLRAGK